MGVTRIDRRTTETAREERLPEAEGRGEHFYGQTEFAKQTNATPKITADATQRGNPLLTRESMELTADEEQGIFNDIGLVAEAYQRYAPTSSSKEELQANIAKDVNSRLVRMALDEFKRQMHKD